MAFFFSAISVVENRRKIDNTGKIVTDEDGDEKNTSAARVVYWPAISYWIAVQSQKGTRVSIVLVHSIVLEIEMDG